MGKLNEIGWFKISTEIRMDEFKEYAESVQAFLEQQIKLIEEDYDKRADGLSDKEKEELFEGMYENDFYNFNKSFPNILRESLFISCYAYLEKELMNLCKFIEKRNDFKIDLADLKHNGIIKAQVFIKKVAEVNFPEETNSWNKILKFNIIRNHLVHEGTSTIKKGTRIFYACRDLGTLTLEHRFSKEETQEDFYHLELTQDFSLDFIRTVSEFFSELYKAFDKK
ncbi:hypothetical protein MUN89_19680 [Halobacillus salinarum]|uniref:Apea-like HEPN domain-containing protein n=1 Tax=Halobacillus salinarum TaxID=2932257 RepID=A0ABY4EJM7_9BACI|nr:hypothetical protein [Halobacillus salinarum]UOQ44058.1 hypothetical protein MUN89_19680 [Halobacillus salinarum]